MSCRNPKIKNSAENCKTLETLAPKIQNSQNFTLRVFGGALREVVHPYPNFTSAQPLGSRSPVLNHKHVQLSRSLSHSVTQENYMEYHIISTLCTEENSKPITWAPSQRGTNCFISNNTSISWASLPFLAAHNISSPSQRE
jgi:hypothetical protein